MKNLWPSLFVQGKGYGNKEFLEGLLGKDEAKNDEVQKGLTPIDRLMQDMTKIVVDAQFEAFYGTLHSGAKKVVFK